MIYAWISSPGDSDIMVLGTAWALGFLQVASLMVILQPKWKTTANAAAFFCLHDLVILPAHALMRRNLSGSHSNPI